jgi:hypothetical protein
MLGSLTFALCVFLHYHYHDPIPWYIWVFAIFLSFSEHAGKFREA